MRFFLELCYDGSDYAGWQRQPGVETVQGCLEDALKTFFQKDISVTGCGRTDKGVHATYYVAHCDLDIDPSIADHVVYRLNHILSKSIACQRLVAVSADAHARYDAVARSYKYDIHFFKNPFLSKYSTYVSYRDKIDLDALNQVAEIISSTKDFKSFCKMHGTNTSMKCNVSRSEWQLSGDNRKLAYIITSNRFLRGMVRLIVGSSLSVATGKLSLTMLEEQIAAGLRNPHMRSASPTGLSLVNITYPYLKR